MAKKQKRPAGVSAEDEAKLSALLVSLQKAHGENCISTVEQPLTMGRFDRQTSSGSIGLDIAIGPMKRLANGRWQTGRPRGAITEIFGPESAGKTTLTLLALANSQMGGGRCAFLDMEHALDPVYAKRLGVRMEELWFSQPDSGDQCLQILDKLVRSGMFDTIVVDSVAALVPQAELDGDVGDSSIGRQARLMSQTMRMLTPYMGINKRTEIIFVNQLRDKIGVMFGSPEITPGGKALKYAATFRIDVRRTKNIKLGGSETDDQTDSAIIGHRMKLKVIKNKVASPFRIAEVPLIYGVGIDTIDELFDLCKLYGLIAGDGWFTLPDGKKYQGKANAVAELRRNQPMSYFLFDQLMTRNMAANGCNPDGSPIDGFLNNLMPPQHVQFEPPTPEQLAMAQGQDDQDDQGT